MAHYLIYFNQEWVGDHTEEWFLSRVEPAKAVVEEMKAAGVYVFAGGVEQEGPVVTADPTSGDVVLTDGPYVEHHQRVGGFCVVDVATEGQARTWAARVAEGCGWPQEMRRVW
jgi:hypothetical protein